jgi:phage/plasmid-associated DNA primase
VAGPLEGAVELPTPAETDAIAREELREAAQRKQYPAARGLAAFLREPAQTQMITGKGDSRTNIIDQGDRVTYAMPGDTVQSLFNHLEEVRRSGLASHFSERQGTPDAPTSGLMLDYDLIVASRDAQLQDRHVHRISCQVVRALRRDLIFPPEAAARRSDVALHVFTIVKPEPVAVLAGPSEDGAPREGARFKYGFHVLVPGIRVSRGYKKYLLRALREDAAINGVLGDLGVVGDPRACLDMNSPSVPVLYLGSCKRGGTPYVMGPAFEVSFEAAGGQARVADEGFYPMVTALRPYELEAAGYNLVAEASLCFEAKYPAGKAPLVRAHECSYRPELAPEIEDLANRTRDQVVGEEELLLAEHSLSTLAIHDPEARYLHQILDLLDETYHTERNKWRDVIFALANTSETYKPLAEWFSHKCPVKWADGGRDTLDLIWEDAVARRGAVANPLTRRSIIRWAQLCNPERFRQISDQNYFIILSKYVYDYGGVLEHAMVARVLYAMLGNKFIVDVDETLGRRSPYVWFEFVVPGQSARPGEVWKWRREAEPDELQKYISENLVKVFDQVAEHIDEQQAEADDEGKAKYYSKLGATFLASRRKIFNDTFKNGVIKQANYLFRRRNFVDTLDQDPDCIGVGNGVLRLGPTCTLIDHFHEIPIMKFTPVAYHGFDPENPWTKLMLNAIADIIPEPDFREWLLFFAASSLAGGVKEGLLLLWHGGGANGKTWFMRMVAKVLGKNYATKLDIGLLTAERSKPNDPNSAMMQLKGMHWGYVEETRKAEPLNDQRLKEIVNPGEISGNEKFKQQETFEITANIAVGQNYDFVVDTVDHGTWRRLKHYHSKVRFCSDPDPANPFEKKDDQRYVREYINDPACQAAFLSILVHYYERLQREHGGLLKGINCPTLDRETEIFRNSQDSVNRFVTQSIVLSPGGGFEYPLANLAQSYHEWYDKNIDRRRHVASETIQDLENSALGKYIRRAANKTMVLTGCRVLSADSPGLLAGEAYLGVTAEGAEDAEQKALAAAIAPEAARARWWEPPAAHTTERQAVEARAARREVAADDTEYHFLDDADIPEPGVAARAAAREDNLLANDEIEDLLAREEYSPWDGGHVYGPADVFGDDYE